jgi:hypothetical protein
MKAFILAGCITSLALVLLYGAKSAEVASITVTYGKNKTMLQAGSQPLVLSSTALGLDCPKCDVKSKPATISIQNTSKIKDLMVHISATDGLNLQSSMNPACGPTACKLQPNDPPAVMQVSCKKGCTGKDQITISL